MSLINPPGIINDTSVIFDDLVMTFDSWILAPVAFIYLQGTYRPSVALQSTHDPDPDLVGAL